MDDLIMDADAIWVTLSPCRHSLKFVILRVGGRKTVSPARSLHQFQALEEIELPFPFLVDTQSPGGQLQCLPSSTESLKSLYLTKHTCKNLLAPRGALMELLSSLQGRSPMLLALRDLRLGTPEGGWTEELRPRLEAMKQNFAAQGLTLA
jgi:hypothetical protein